MSENKYALLIASSEYDDPYFRRLEAPGKDVDAFSRVLLDPAMGGFFDVKTLENKPKDALVLAIEDFFDNRNTEDLLLLYFSCHGVKDADGRLYYAAKNTLHTRLVSSGVPAYVVNDLIAKCRSRRKILVLDCCYSGAFSRATLTKGDQSVGVTEQFEEGRGLVTLTASDAFQYSFEGEKLNNAAVYSLFTRALVDGIETGKADRDGDQRISLDEWYRYAFERVHSERPEQTPRRSGEVEGDIFVARNPQPPAPAELPWKLSDAIESVFVGARLQAVEELSRLLHDRNKGLALAAREALLRLREDDSFRVRTAAQDCLNAFDQVEGREEEASQLNAEHARLAREKAEAQERARQEAVARAEAERLAREKAEQQRLERERAEQERLAKEQAEERNDLGIALETTGDLEGALNEFRRGGDLDRSDPDYRVAYERVLKEQRDTVKLPPKGLADLIGASGVTVDWRMAFTFWLAQSTLGLIEGPRVSWRLYAGLSSLIFTFCALAGFRWIRNRFGALVVASTAIALLAGGLFLMFSAMTGLPPYFSGGAWRFVIDFARAFVLLGALELLLQRLRSLWFALLIGSGVAEVLASLLEPALHARFPIFAIVFGGLLQSLIFATVFWLGLRLIKWRDEATRRPVT